MVFSCLFHCLIGKKNTGTECNYSDFLKLSYNTLFEATDRFSSENLIGVGTFGSVYKVVLVTPPDTDQVLAVKVFNMLHPEALKSFNAECEALRNIRHRNILKIITTCSSIDFRGNDFKALVYEFKDNGSLEEWLHPTTGTRKVRNPTKNLSLVERLDIAIDVACALDYLHNHCETPILHCDLKPSNILLDKDLTGQVSDFGLSRFLSKPNNISTKQTSVIGLSGSVSYIAPEYKMGSEASTYGDVYSFGILLLELFTGKKPSDDMFKDSLNLHNFVKTALFDGVLAEIADSRLLLQGGNDNPPSKCSVRFKLEIEECLRLIFEIGIVCSNESPRDRMDMSYVVSELNSIRDDFQNRVRTYSQTVGVRSRLCSSCMVCRRRMNEHAAWSWSWSNRCYRQFCASRLLSPLYEFVDNGSLEVWLHPSIGTEDERGVPTNLSLIQRVEIAVDVACALDYLHNRCARPIVHCDLKPSNVLLDKELIGHVSDIGLERLPSKLSNSVSGNQSSSTGIIGSMGYAAPDSILLLQGGTSDTQTNEECLISIFKIGIACSTGAVRDRMNINRVVPKLHSIRDRLLCLQRFSTVL